MQPTRYEHEYEAVREQRDLLRSALAGVVGVSTREELEQMEVVMRLMPAPNQDKADVINAIHALLATVDEGATTDARFTPSDEGKATGSATKESESK